MILILLLSISITIFEVSFRDIYLFQHVSLIFIIVNILYWHKRYDISIFVGVISSILIDLLIQNRFGETQLAIFIPIFILSVFDNLLRLESKLSRVVYASVGTGLSILISDFLLNLVFFNGEFDIDILVRRIITSVIITVLITIIFGNTLLAKSKTSRYS